MPVGAAIGIAGALGAAGAVGSSMIQSRAAQQASQQSIQAQQQMFGLAQGQLAPFIGAGASALPTLQALLTPGPNQTATLAQTPGFQFASDWGQQAVRNQGTTMGLGGNTLASGARFATGLAQNTFFPTINALQSLASMGQGGASSLAGLATGAGQSIGNTAAAGTLGSANALAGGIQGATSGIGNALLLSRLLGGSGGAGTPNYANTPLSGSDASTNALLFPGYGTASGIYA